MPARPEGAKHDSPGQAQRRPGSEGDQQMSPERAKETNAHRQAIALFRPFRAGESDYCIPRAALRLPWADMFLALQADLCSTTRATPWVWIAGNIVSPERATQPVSPFRGLPVVCLSCPRALPWAFMLCPFGTENNRHLTAEVLQDVII